MFSIEQCKRNQIYPQKNVKIFTDCWTKYDSFEMQPSKWILDDWTPQISGIQLQKFFWKFRGSIKTQQLAQKGVGILKQMPWADPLYQHFGK